MSRASLRLIVASGLFIGWMASKSATPDERTAAEILPDSTVACVEFPRLSSVVDLVLEHPLRKQVESFEPYQDALRSPKYGTFQTILGYIESRIGMSWREAVSSLTDGGVSIAFDAPSEGVVLLAKSRDAATLKKLRDVFLQLARDDARKKGNPEPFEELEYRDVTVYKMNNGGFATVGPWLVIANKEEIGKKILDRLVDRDTPVTGPRSVLAERKSYQEARQQKPETVAGWAWVDVDFLRQVQAARGKPIVTRTDNPVGELLIGGLLDTLQKTTWLTAALTLERDQVGLAFQTPHRNDWVSEARGYYFGTDGKGTAPAVPAIDGLLMSLGSHRDLSGLWLRAGDLFDVNIVDKFAKADGDLSVFFGGRDFGEEILGSFGPQVQIIVARQTFETLTSAPDIRLPSFAILFDMKDPEKMTQDFRRTFQSAIGFINVLGAMNGQPQLDIERETKDGVELVVTRYLPGNNESEKTPKIHYNFSPTVAFAGSRFILSSTESLARQLAAANGKTEAPQAGTAPVTNTALRIDGPVLREMLEANRDHLVTQNMLKEGHTKAEAEFQIGILLGILGGLRDLSIDLSHVEETLRLDARLRLLTE